MRLDCREQWAAQNADAIRAYNEHVTQHGSFNTMHSIEDGAGHTDQERANVHVAVAFYETLLNAKDVDAARQYVGPHYRQHSPLAADGFAALRAFLLAMFEQHPQMRIEIKRAFADGDYVILHVHARLGPEDRGAAVVDIFRFEHGKIVEHWDVLQQIPEAAPNANSMF